MRTFIIGFSRARSKFSIVSKLIMWIQGTSFSHVYIKFDSEFLERDFIYQASRTSVNFENIQTFESESITVKEFKLEVLPEDYKKILQFSIDNVAKPYGTQELLGMFIVTIFDLFGKKIKNPLGDKNKTFICSELANYILDSFMDANISTDIDSVTPKDVYNYLINRNL